MPDLVTHYYFGERVLQKLDLDIRMNIFDCDLYYFTTGGPDPFFYYKFLKGKENSRISSFGNFMHRNHSFKFFNELINELKNEKDKTKKDTLFSFICGFITHYSLDSTCHPYIFNRTGEYTKTKETLKYRGLHMKLERAIDSYFLKEHYHVNPSTVKLYKRFLPLKRLPQNLEETLNRVFKKVYFNQPYINFYKENFFKIYNKALKSQSFCYRFIYDRFGLKNFIFSKIDNGKGGVDFSKLSYYKKSLENCDILNIHHDIWTSPINPKDTHYESFLELIDKAQDMAVKLINVTYYYAYCDDDIDLSKYFTNLSYLSGINCDDPMKDKIEHFNLIEFK